MHSADYLYSLQKNQTVYSLQSVAVLIEHFLALLWTKLATLSTFSAEKCRRRIKESCHVLQDEVLCNNALRYTTADPEKLIWLSSMS